MHQDNTIILSVAMKAVIFNDEGKVLVVREALDHDTNTKAGLFGLVGGRIEPGENHIDGLKREVNEEVRLSIEPLFPVLTGEWHPEIKGVKHQIIAFFMACKIIGEQEVVLSEEHDKFLWVSQEDLEEIGMMVPDIDAVKRFFEINSKLV